MCACTWEYVGEFEQNFLRCSCSYQENINNMKWSDLFRDLQHSKTTLVEEKHPS